MTTAMIVVSFQGRDDLPGCLASCRSHAPDVPVVVVDNASTDGSPEVAAKAAPDATVIRLAENAGFAGGNNIGITIAMKAQAEYVLLINQDAQLRSGTVRRLAAFLDAHPQAAAVQAGILLPDGRVNTMGNAFNYLGFTYAGGNGLTVDQARERLPWLRLPGAWEEGAEVACASGAALMLRSAALERVGLFEEELFLYHEDFELSLRLRSQGWTVHVLPSAEVVHHYHFSRNPEKWYFLERNRHWVWMAHMKLPTLGLLLLPALAAELAVWVQAISGGWWRQKLRSYLYWRSSGKRAYLRKRRGELRLRRRLSDRELLAAAGGQLESLDVGGSALERVVNPLSGRAWRGLYKLVRW
jgi:GT2 family glycosyltransferase